MSAQDKAVVKRIANAWEPPADEPPAATAAEAGPSDGDAAEALRVLGGYVLSLQSEVRPAGGWYGAAVKLKDARDLCNLMGPRCLAMDSLYLKAGRPIPGGERERAARTVVALIEAASMIARDLGIAAADVVAAGRDVAAKIAAAHADA